VRALEPVLARELVPVREPALVLAHHRLLVEARRLAGMGISSRVEATTIIAVDTTNTAAHRTTMVSRNSDSRSRTISRCCGITRPDRSQVLADRDRGDIAAAQEFPSAEHRSALVCV
jgi:hypothetical protein